MATVRITVLYFAAVKELCQKSEEVFFVSEGTDTTQLLTSITEKYPSLQPIIPAIILSLNLEFVGDLPKILHDGDEVALIPPISGG